MSELKLGLTLNFSHFLEQRLRNFKTSNRFHLASA